MTRDEAIDILMPTLGNTGDWRGKWIDAYVSLGMLKLDEPKSVETMLAEALRSAGLSQLAIDTFCDVLERSHLKIVEKGLAP